MDGKVYFNIFWRWVGWVRLGAVGGVETEDGVGTVGEMRTVGGLETVGEVGNGG